MDALFLAWCQGVQAALDGLSGPISMQIHTLREQRFCEGQEAWRCAWMANGFITWAQSIQLRSQGLDCLMDDGENPRRQLSSNAHSTLSDIPGVMGHVQKTLAPDLP